MPRWTTYLLGILPFLLIVGVYLYVSDQRRQENPRDKLMPGLTQLWEGWQAVMELRQGTFVDYTVEEGDTLESIAAEISGDASFADRIRPDGGEALDPPRPLVPGETLRVRTTYRYLTSDIAISLWRLGVGLGIGAGVSLVLGLLMGAFTPVDKLFQPLAAAFSKIPPLAILPIIFIALGADNETSKIAIIALGIAPTMTLDIYMRARDVPRELITKAYTLGASTAEVVFKVILPLTWPSVLNSLRLVLGPAWVFLIAAEAIASEAGLGYRIFVVQRQLGMNIILIYVAIIMGIGLAMDGALRGLLTWRYKWAEVK